MVRSVGYTGDCGSRLGTTGEASLKGQTKSPRTTERGGGANGALSDQSWDGPLSGLLAEGEMDDLHLVGLSANLQGSVTQRDKASPVPKPLSASAWCAARCSPHSEAGRSSEAPVQALHPSAPRASAPCTSPKHRLGGTGENKSNLPVAAAHAWHGRSLPGWALCSAATHIAHPGRLPVPSASWCSCFQCRIPLWAHQLSWTISLAGAGLVSLPAASRAPGRSSRSPPLPPK